MPSKHLQMIVLRDNTQNCPPDHAAEFAATMEQLNSRLPLHVDSVRWSDQTLALRFADGLVAEFGAHPQVMTLKLTRNVDPGLTNAGVPLTVTYNGHEFTWDRADLAGHIVGNRLTWLSAAASVSTLFPQFADGFDLMVARCKVPSENRKLLLWTGGPRETAGISLCGPE